MEQWERVVIDGIEYDYEVSDMGNVRNMKTGKMLKAQDKRGYLNVTLCKDGKCKQMSVHRLVATVFIPNPKGLETVNHKNEIKTDNRVENLEWMTREDNISYSKSKKVMGISLTETKVIVFKSTQQAEKFGFCHGCISECCNNKHGKNKNEYKGYKWSYVE